MPNTFPLLPKQILQGTTTTTENQQHVAAFRQCFERFQECQEFRDSDNVTGSYEAVENFILDFELTGKRTLASQPLAAQLFRMFFVESQTLQACARTLQVDPFTLARTKIAVETTVGAALTNRGLFPVARYFGEVFSPAGDTSRLIPQAA